MKRREFITLLGGAASWPLTARTQQIPVVGFLASESREASESRLRGFKEGLSESGYVEGRNVAVEYRWANGRYDRLPGLAADLVRREVSVISAIGAVPTALAAKAATSAIPIVFQSGIDPVGAGLVRSLNRPGGNLTGVTNLNVELASKRLELLHEVVPTAITFGVLTNPTNANIADTVMKDMQGAADAYGLQLHELQASTIQEIDKAFTNLVALRARALVIGPFAYFNTRHEQIAALCVRDAVPAVFQRREFVAAGGLMSYGGSTTEAWRVAGLYTGRILKGEKPSDLPVQRVTKVELIVNLKTARTLGITIPLPLLARADEVIE